MNYQEELLNEQVFYGLFITVAFLTMAISMMIKFRSPELDDMLKNLDADKKNNP